MSEPSKQAILLVDDESSILEVAEEYFRIKGYQVFTACNGREAMQVLTSEKIDCCFTDINMPEMDGIDLAETIRKNDNSIPVIIMTGFPSLDNTIRTVKNGVVDFLIKPVSLNQMEICLKRVLRERRLLIENILLKKQVDGIEQLEKLNTELISKVNELNTLHSIVTSFSNIHTSTSVFSHAVDMAVEITPADESRFYVFDETTDLPMQVVVRASLSLPPPSDSLLKTIASDRIPLLVPENKAVDGLPSDVQSFMAVPMNIRNKIFGVLTAASACRKAHFSEKDLYYLSCMTQNAAQALENLALYEHIHENLFSTLYAFVKALEARDSYTDQHSNRVTDIAVIIGKSMGCRKEDLDTLSFAARLHDIGKLGIPDNILLKPDRLTDEEFEKIKEHPVIGAGIVGQLGLWDTEKSLIRSHHERFDGTGYPDGLKGEAIPFLARIMSVADAYDAMASDRAYRNRMETETILHIIEKAAGHQFDPDIAQLFLRLHRAGKIPW